MGVQCLDFQTVNHNVVDWDWRDCAFRTNVHPRPRHVPGQSGGPYWNPDPQKDHYRHRNSLFGCPAILEPHTIDFEVSRVLRAPESTDPITMSPPYSYDFVWQNHSFNGTVVDHRYTHIHTRILSSGISLVTYR